jgi:CheY-like chemotaxis protein
MEKKPLILLVDDNEDTRIVISMILKKNGFNCETRSSGEEALALMDSGLIPDLILSDILMPDMDGYEFFCRVQQNSHWRYIPFIFLSSKDSVEDLRKGREMGVDDYLSKPVMPDLLVSSILGKLKRFKQLANSNSRAESSETKQGNGDCGKMSQIEMA